MKNTEHSEISEPERNSAIADALKNIGKGFDPSLYEIYTTKKEDYIEVKFKMHIKFVPLNSHFIYDIIDGQGTISYPISNPFNFKNPNDSSTFYVPTEDHKRQIKFVLEALKNADDPIVLDEIKGYKNFVILESEDRYEINISTHGHTEATLEVNRITGEVTDHGHMHLTPAPGIPQ